MMNPPDKPVRRRKGRGARERILAAAGDLLYRQGIAATGMDQLSKAANVTNRTLYQHFASKDDLVAAYLAQAAQAARNAEATFADASPRQRLLAIFDTLRMLQQQSGPDDPGEVRGCPFLNVAIEVPDPGHPAHALTTAEKLSFAARLAKIAHEAGATDPDRLGEQLALLYDGAAIRSVALNTLATADTAREIAELLIDRALPGPESR
jgi:AcrR family transcriptional regulator